MFRSEPGEQPKRSGIGKDVGQATTLEQVAQARRQLFYDEMQEMQLRKSIDFRNGPTPHFHTRT